MAKKLGRIALGAAIFVGWLCFVLLLQSLGTVSETESGTAVVTSVVTGGSALSVPLNPSEAYLSSLSATDWTRAIEEALVRSPVFAQLGVDLERVGVTARAENFVPGSGYTRGRPPYPFATVYDSVFSYDVVLEWGGEELRLPGVVARPHTYGPSPRAGAELLIQNFYYETGPTVAVCEPSLILVTTEQGTQLFATGWSAAGEPLSAPRSEIIVYDSVVNAHGEQIVALAAAGEEYLFFSGAADSEPTLIPLRSQDDFWERPLPEGEHDLFKIDAPLFAGGVRIQTWDGRYVWMAVYGAWGTDPAAHMVYDREDGSVRLYETVLPVNEEAWMSGESMFSVHRLRAVLRGDRTMNMMVWLEGTDIGDPAWTFVTGEEQNEIVDYYKNYFWTSESGLQVQVARQKEQVASVTTYDGVVAVTFDFRHGTIQREYRPDRLRCTSPSGRYRAHTVLSNLWYPFFSYTLYVEDTHTGAVHYIDDITFNASLFFVGEEIIGVGLDWEQGMAFFSVEGERLGWHMEPPSPAPEDYSEYHMLLGGVYDSPRDQFVVLSVTVEDLEDYDAWTAVGFLTVNYYNRAGEKIDSFRTDSEIHDNDGFPTARNLQMENGHITFAVKEWWNGDPMIVEYDIDLITQQVTTTVRKGDLYADMY